MHLDEQQIGQIISGVADLLRHNEKQRKEESKRAFSPVYRQSVEMAQKISVHAKYGQFPHKLLAAKAPNQDPAEWEYQKRIYPVPSITMPYWYKALGALNRIWNDNNWSIIWMEEDAGEDSAQKYFEREYPKYGSYEAYHKEIYLTKKINDPNSVAAYRPLYLPTRDAENEDGEIETVFDDTQLPVPVEVIFPSENVVQFIDGLYFIGILNENSIVTVGGKKEQTGLILELYDSDNIYRIAQYGNKKDYTFDIALYYTHNIGVLPARKLKGRPEEVDGHVLYYSHFLPAVSMLDEAVRNFSTEQMSIYSQAFPVRWQYTDRCDEAGCISGYIQTIDEGEAKKELCHSCKGTGKKSKISPTGVLEMDAGGRLQEGDKELPTPPMGWVSPSPEILTFLSEKYQSQIRSAFAMLNIELSTSDSKGSETALGKMIDREEFFSFLKAISDEVFEAFEFGINIMGIMRYGERFVPPQMVYPRNFQIRNDYEITEEISKAKSAGLPDIAIRELLEQWIHLRFNKNANVGKIVEFVFKVDRLVAKSDVDINAGISLGTVAKWEKILHDSIYTFIAQSADEISDETFDVMKNKLESLAKDKAAEIAPEKISTEIILAKGFAEAE